MKKVLTIALVAIILMMSAMTVVNAATSSTLPDELYAIGSYYGMTENDRVKMQQYLRQYPLSEADCNEILDLARQAQQIMIAHNARNYHSLPEDVQRQLQALALRAADIAGVTLDFKARRIDVYKDGKWINSFGSDTLVSTGSQVNIALVVSSVAVIALAATAITVATKKRLSANA